MTIDFMVPSMVTITIRENNGDDEGLLSTISASADGSNVRNYMANVVEKGVNGKKQLADEFLKWKVNDLYYTLIVQRVFNLGHEFKFTSECPNCKHSNEYEEDLREWIVDEFSPDGNSVQAATPEIELKAIKNSPPAYPLGGLDLVQVTLSNQMQFRFEILTIEGERRLDTMSSTQRNINASLIQRNLEMLMPEGWKKITFFRDLNSRLMAELRGAVAKHDKQWQPLAELTCEQCGDKSKENLLFLPGFYYPEVMI